MQQSSSAKHTNSIPQAQVWTRSVRRSSGTQPKMPKHSSRYERLSFSMLGYTWGILIVTVTALHFGNYHLETKTSSTSGSHLGFHESSNAIKPDAESTQTPALEGAKP